MNSRRPIAILVADDDPDDRAMTQDAVEENRLSNPVHFVADGLEALAEIKADPFTPGARRLLATVPNERLDKPSNVAQLLSVVAARLS